MTLAPAVRCVNYNPFTPSIISVQSPQSTPDFGVRRYAPLIISPSLGSPPYLSEAPRARRKAKDRVK